MHYDMINPSILIGELPLAEQLRLVKEQGFSEVELWWPFDSATPSRVEIKQFLATLEASGLQLNGLNTYEGGMALGNRGIACWEGAEEELAASIAVAIEIGIATGCRMFNVLHGTIDPEKDRDEQDARAARNTAWAADALAEIGGTVTIEQLSHIPAYGLKTGAQVIAAMDRAIAVSGATNIRMQVDLFHMAMIGDDIPAFFDEHWDRIAHVQVADAPGRGGPGTGDLPIDAYLERLRANGYTGRFALEYSASDAVTGDPFGWMRP